MSDKKSPFDSNRLPAEDLANEDRAEPVTSPLESDELGPDDWDGIDTSVSEEVSLEALREGEAANDNEFDDDDDNPFEDSDEALPDDSEEHAIGQDLLESTERGRFGDEQ